MNNLLKDKTVEDFCVIFPSGSDQVLDPMKSKCEQIGINWKENDLREIFKYEEAEQNREEFLLFCEQSRTIRKYADFNWIQLWNITTEFKKKRLANH